MVLVGKVNKEIVLRLNRHGQPAVGLCGDDGSLFRVSRRSAPGGEDIGFVGRIDRVDVDVLRHVAMDYIPVVASVGADREGNSYNINADEAAGAIARTIGAYKVIFLTDVAGWLADAADPSSLITRADAAQVRGALRRPRRRHAPEAGRMPGRDRRRRELRGDRRRTRSPQRAHRAVHRRRPRHHDHRVGRPDVSLAEMQELERSSVALSYARLPVQFVRGRGTVLWDDEGREYLDFLCGIGVTSTGHCHPQVVAAVREQVGELIHISNLFYNEPAMRLAARLSESSLGGKVFFCNSGAEAIEAAIKVARKARAGGDIVVVHNAFHGRTYGALSATPQESKQAPFAPLVPGFRAVEATAEAVGGAVDGRTAAVLLEPIQGETGVHVLPDEVLEAARAACDAHGAALIFDEIQCGLGRTGTLWAYEQTGVTPDAITTAKALAGGLPMGALITGPRLADVLVPGDHGSTFAGGPTIAAAAHAALDVLGDAALLARVSELGARLAEGLARLPRVLDVRGRGLMLAAEVDVPAGDVARRALLDERLIVNATGPTTIRLLPPLTVSEAEIDEALRRLGRVLA